MYLGSNHKTLATPIRDIVRDRHGGYVRYASLPLVMDVSERRGRSRANRDPDQDFSRDPTGAYTRTVRIRDRLAVIFSREQQRSYIGQLRQSRVRLDMIEQAWKAEQATALEMARRIMEAKT